MFELQFVWVQHEKLYDLDSGISVDWQKDEIILRLIL